ncbi:hypothetical protein ACFL4K_00820 [Candidatus Neomarinimicrobiota bacterium]
MARPKTPTKILETRGSFKNHPERKREGEPQPTGPIGDPPDRMPDEEKAIWQELIEQIPKGVLTNADRVMFEVACGLIFLFRTQRPKNISSSKLSMLSTILGKFGLTPADRAKITVSGEEEENPYEKIGRARAAQA